MEMFSALLAICAGNSPVSGEFPTQRPVTRSLRCVWINGWANNPEAGDLRRYRAHYDVTVMEYTYFISYDVIITMVNVIGIGCFDVLYHWLLLLIQNNVYAGCNESFLNWSNYKISRRRRQWSRSLNIVYYKSGQTRTTFFRCISANKCYDVANNTYPLELMISDNRSIWYQFNGYTRRVHTRVHF